MKFFKTPKSLFLITLYILIITFATWYFKASPPKPVQVVVKQDPIKVIQLAQEWAYFEGQKEALKGDVRIEFNSVTGKYKWKKSCWDGGMAPIFDPSISESMSYFLK